MNPILPLNFYMPDAEPRIFGDTLYLYGSHDIYNSENYCEGELYVAYAKLNDLTHFELKKILTFDDSGHSFLEAGAFQAPDCIEFNGKYYLYDNRMKRPNCDVAISDSPLGPFKNYGCIQNKDGSPLDYRFFDPAIFIDDDTGFCPGKQSRFAKLANPYSQVFELEPDMKTVKAGPFDLIPGPLKSENTSFSNHPFFEASSMRKFNGKYYFIYSSELSHELAYAVSDNPISGFEFKGTLISNANIGYENNTIYELPWGNTHGSVEKINNDYYVFFHRQTSGRETARQACVAKLNYSNNLFSQAEYTSLGFDEKLKLNKKINATYASYLTSKKDNIKLTVGSLNDIDKQYATIKEDITNNDIHYINIIDNAIVGFKYFDFSLAKSIKLKVKGKTGHINIRQDLNGEIIGGVFLNENIEEYNIPCNFKEIIGPLYIEFIDTYDTKFFEIEIIS